MVRKENKKGQAAIELAVFGAILIFILGTIVRSAVGNGYTQNQNFKAMRMALLASWRGSQQSNPVNISRNSASILFVEDRLSPDISKYGDLDRNLFIAQGSGTFSYNLEYPLDPNEASTNLPVMDVYINGQYFPFSLASYVSNKPISRPASCSAYQVNSCAYNQCERNVREWAGGIVNESQFGNIIPPTALNAGTGTIMATNTSAIFTDLVNAGLIGNSGGADLTQGGSGLTGTVTTLVSSGSFIGSYANAFPGLNLTPAQLNQVQSILQSNMTSYKLFYTREASGSPQFSTSPPGCSSPPASEQALCSSLTGLDINNNQFTNSNGDMQYDLLRLGNYTTDATNPVTDVTIPAVETRFPTGGPMRFYMAWEWGASAAINASTIGLDVSNNQYPTYDIDGRLKEVTVYGISQNSDGTPVVSYEDFQGGDIDGTWDSNSCGVKPGLQSSSQIYTFTQQGTYLQIKDGKLYNPETDQFVRSVNQRDTIDLIQRSIQLSNNTGRFCNDSNGPTFTQNCIGGDCTHYPPSTDPNPVEVCIPANSTTENCFSSEQNIKSTCYDEHDNMLFIRSRLEDRRGHYWMTDTSGQMSVK